jgi:outer membrane lipoprotein SlyB
MRGKFVRSALLPLALAAALGACASNGVQPGFVNTASTATPPPGSSGRVVAINDVSLQGGGGGSSGSGQGPLIGGLLGGLGGAAIGASGGRGLGGGLIGGVLGVVGGAIAGTIVDRHSGSVGGGRGIQVTVESDDGQKAVVAQRDDGDIQLGDRVQIVKGPGGVPQVVRENSRAPDVQQNSPPPPDYRQSRNYGPPAQDYGPPPGHGPVSRDYGPVPQDNGQSRSYPPPQDNGPPPQDYRQPQGNSPSPQDDPRYGTLN